MSRQQQPLKTESNVSSEQQFFDKWKKHPSPFVQSVLEDRRKRLEHGEHLPSKNELDTEIRQTRYGDDVS